MNPEADNLYDCLGAHPGESHGELGKKISQFIANHGRDYPTKKTKIERNLKNLNDRREYNRVRGYPTTFGVVPLSITAPDIVEVGETITIAVEDDEGDAVPGASITAEGADLGETDEAGKCSIEFHRAETITLTASKGDPDEDYGDATAEIEAVKESKELEIDLEFEEAAVNETVTVTVTAGGDPVAGATVTTADNTEATGSSGTCQLGLSTVGEQIIEASKDDEDGVTYVDTSTKIDVEKRVVSLDLSADPKFVEIGERVSFSVTDEDGNHVDNASLTYDGGTMTTDMWGVADITFDEAGTVTVKASKRDDDTTEYENDEVKISVGARSRSLSIEASPDPVELGHTVTVRTTVNDSPIDRASVIAEGRTKTTDSNGECTFSFSSTGEIKIQATKEDTPTVDYTEATTTVKVTKATRGLTIKSDKDTVKIREPLSVRVSDATGGVADAVVEGPSTDDQTDEHGTCTLQLQTVGDVEITATRSNTEDVDYRSATKTVTVEPKQIDLEVTVDQDEIEIGDDVEVTVTAGGDPVPDTEIRANGTVKRIGSGETCILNPSTIGTVEITADKEDTSRVKYIPDKTDIEVTRARKKLYVEVPDNATAGETVQVTVFKEDGSRLKNATVESPVHRTRTDDRGRCSIELPETGNSPIFLSAKKATEEGIHYSQARTPVEVDGLSAPDTSESAPMSGVLAVMGIILLFPLIGIAVLLGLPSDIVIGSLIAIILLILSIFGLARMPV